MTTFPVMFAVNTCPSPSTLAASTIPVTNVSSASDANIREVGSVVMVLARIVLAPTAVHR
jgi:hypothetical protein